MAHKEYKNDLKAFTNGTEVPGAKYEFEYTPEVGPKKKIKSVAIGMTERHSNYPVQQVCDLPNANTYDIQTNYGFVNIKDAQNEMRRLKKEQKEHAKQGVHYDLNPENFPNTKTSYRIRGG